jgi:CheY-like chemotaxis protein
MKRKPVNILIVDDRADDLELARVAFERASVPNRLFSVTDGEAALDYLAGKNHYHDRERFPFPDIMLLDLKMPKLNGFEVLQTARWTHNIPNLLIYMLSVSDLDRDIERAYALGANAYLVKPTDFALLTKMFESLLTFHTLIAPP